ncbi:MAG TPA: CDP-alcohol phosphatidyltransferase family protein [Methylocystis sp.]|nr:CDP-alcohol phosphatidyltransferase family protein [Methylocystis sp.]
MTLYDIKPRFQALLRPLVAFIHARGATANAVTVAAAAGSVLLGALLARFGAEHAGLYLLLPVWLFIRMALNAMDGMLAREFGQKSALGAYLNELCDVVSDAALILPFAYVQNFDAAQIVVIVVLAGLVEFAGALAPTVGAPRRYDGPMGKSDRALAFGALGFWFGWAGSIPSFVTVTAQVVLIALHAATIVARVRSGLEAAKELEPS